MSVVKLYDDRYFKLKEVEWDFKDCSTDDLASIHPYPARFIPEIPKMLIQSLECPKNQIVFDPFCGSGTTLLEASRMGYESVGVDLNPIACLISSVKLNPLPNNFLEISEKVMVNAQHTYLGNVEIPEIPNLDHWFKKDIQKAIAALCSELNKVVDPLVQNGLRLALSSIIVRVSNQESDTRYAAVSNNYAAKDVFKKFYNSCKKLSEAKMDNDHYEKSRVIESDILKVSAEEIGDNVGVVITSPPYPNAYEYWLYHKYRMWWLGYNPIDVRTFEIGARPHYQKRNGQTEVDFKNQMSSVFSLLNQCLIVGGHVCFVVGRSIIKGRVIDNAHLISEVALEHGMSIVADIEREIASTKKSFNLKYGKIKTENIVVFRKDH